MMHLQQSSPIVQLFTTNQLSINAPQILGIGLTRLDTGVHQTFSNACKEWVWVTRLIAFCVASYPLFSNLLFLLCSP